jgi:hypothetical protein
VSAEQDGRAARVELLERAVEHLRDAVLITEGERRDGASSRGLRLGSSVS